MKKLSAAEIVPNTKKALTEGASLTAYRVPRCLGSKERQDACRVEGSVLAPTRAQLASHRRHRLSPAGLCKPKGSYRTRTSRRTEPGHPAEQNRASYLISDLAESHGSWGNMALV